METDVSTADRLVESAYIGGSSNMTTQFGTLAKQVTLRIAVRLGKASSPLEASAEMTKVEHEPRQEFV